MASTIIQVDVPEQVSPVTAYLYVPAGASLIAPDSAGYSLSLDASQGWRYTFIVPEACVGIYRVECQDGDGITVAGGFVRIEADDTSTYIADASYQLLANQVKMDALQVTADTIAAQSTAAAIRAALGMASADLDTQLDALDSHMDTQDSQMDAQDAQIALVKAKTDLISTIRSQIRW